MERRGGGVEGGRETDPLTSRWRLYTEAMETSYQKTARKVKACLGAGTDEEEGAEQESAASHHPSPTFRLSV